MFAVKESVIFMAGSCWERKTLWRVLNRTNGTLRSWATITTSFALEIEY